MLLSTTINQETDKGVDNHRSIGFIRNAGSRHHSNKTGDEFLTYGKNIPRQVSYNLSEKYTTGSHDNLHHHQYFNSRTATEQKPRLLNGLSKIPSKQEKYINSNLSKDQRKMSTNTYRGEQVIEGVGDANIALSPQQLSLEKRRIMLEKLIYGRADKIRETLSQRVNGFREDPDGGLSIPLATRWNDFFGEIR